MLIVIMEREPWGVNDSQDGWAACGLNPGYCKVTKGSSYSQGHGYLDGQFSGIIRSMPSMYRVG